ncbi:MAG: TVP38/TMEM64 family protein, partial [Muricomes sp.]
VFPIAPDDFLCYLAGTTAMTWKQFGCVILLGKPFSIALYSLGLFTLFQKLF